MELEVMLRTLRPFLQEGLFVFVSLRAEEAGVVGVEEAVGFFRESEGLTLILPQSTADRLGLPYSFLGAWITLGLESSLAATGLTAAVSGALGEKGIAGNIWAGVHHDHIFVPAADGTRALKALQDLSQHNSAPPK
jgi:hypothetical protein